MSRQEFTKETKRAALKRSGLRCEGQGTWYGLPEGHRCNTSLPLGVHYDHVILEANSHNNSLENCAAVCPPCHRYKTRTRDIPTAAKTVRQRDKNNGIKSVSRPMPGTKASGIRKRMNGTVERW